MAERAHAPGSWQHGHYGAEATGIVLAEATIAAAWNVQGAATRPTFVDTVAKKFGLFLPLRPNTIAATDELSALWLGPSSWLLIAGDSPLTDFAGKRDGLNAAGGALFDLSASRVALSIAGAHAATLLAKHCPLDFHIRAFPPGTCAQSLFGHVNAIYVRSGEAATFTMLVPRSFADDVWHSLCASASQYGYDVLPAAPYR